MSKKIYFVFIVFFLSFVFFLKHFAFPVHSDAAEPTFIKESVTREEKPGGVVVERRVIYSYEIVSKEIDKVFNFLTDKESYRRDKIGYTKPIVSIPRVDTPLGVSTDPGIVGSNILLALLVFLLVGVPCFLFNNTIESHGDDINKFLKKIPFLNFFVASDAHHNFRRIAGNIVLVFLFALIAAHISPDFSLLKSLNFGIFVVTLSAIILGVYTKDFFRFLIALKWRFKAIFKPNFLGLFLAVFCVLISRYFNVSPGFLFGIPMGLFILSKSFRKKEGPLEFFGLLSMFLLSVAVWFLSPVVKEFEILHDLLSILYLILLEGVFFEMFPLFYLPGGAIYGWNKILWGIFFTIVSFFIFHSLFNPESTLGSLSESQPTINTILILFAFALSGFLVWFSFRKKTTSHS